MGKYDEKEILRCLEIVSNWQPSLEAADRAIERVRKNLTEAQTRQAVSDKRKRRTVKRIIEFAVAAVVIMAVIIGISQFGDTTAKASVSWPNVIRNIERAEMFICRSKRGELNASKQKTYESDSIEYYSSKYGVRWDIYHKERIIAIQYILVAEQAFIRVSLEHKAYTHKTLSEEYVIKALEYYDPKRVVKQLLSSEYTQLPRKTINGIEVEGIEGVLEFERQWVESSVARFWVDVETELPVLIELEGVKDGGNLQIKHIIDEFQWDVELESSVFEPNIPADYALK